MRVLLVHNPKAGKNQTGGAEIERLLAAAGHEVRTAAVSDRLRDSTTCTATDLLAVAGGDGTVRKVALQFVDCPIVIAPLPVGTANNIAQSLGWKVDLDETVRAWESAQPKPIDVGWADGPWGHRCFLEGAGLGLIGRGISVIEEIDRFHDHSYRDAQEKLHRDVSVFAALAGEISSTRIRVCQGQIVQQLDVLLLEALNIRLAGPRIELAFATNPSDGRLDLVIAREDERQRLKQSVLNCLSGIPAQPVLETQPVESLVFEMDRGEFRLDDEVVWSQTEADQPPARIKLGVHRHALRFLFPAA